MQPAPYAHLNKGTLLIASPDIANEMLSRSVVLLCEHSSGGSFGLILNKPLPFDLQDELSVLDNIKNKNVLFTAGGPIQPSQMLLLHSDPNIEDQTVKICESVFLGGDLQFLQEAINQEEGPNLHLVFGYLGWGPGQLEKEFLSGLWYLHPCRKELVFTKESEKLWAKALKEMGGKYVSLSTIPTDLSVN